MARFTGSHDLNFMVGLPTDLGAALDPDPKRQAAYTQARTTAARTLDRRWNGNVQALKSSDYEGRWGVIVDSAMNAPLLIEIGRELGDAGGDERQVLVCAHAPGGDELTGDLDDVASR